MLRRAKSVDIPFMVKGYEIGLRDGNFSKSSMQINSFFAKTMSHKNVHSYIYERNNSPCGYVVLRKKDDNRHEIMMMFVEEALQGQGIGRSIFKEALKGPLKESPIVCSTTQSASKNMMKLLRSFGFEQKKQTAEGIYWEKASGASAASTPAKTGGAPMLTAAPAPRLAIPIPNLVSESGPGPDADALEAATTAVPMRLPSYAPPPAAQPQILDGTAEIVADIAPSADKTEAPAPPVPPPDVTETTSEPPQEALPSAPETPTEVSEQPEEAVALMPSPPPASAEAKSANLPQPPPDFSGRASELGYTSKREQARRLARELFASLKGQEAAPPAVTPVPVEKTEPEEEEDIPLLATLTIVREKMGSLPGVTLPPLDRYSLMEFNKKDLENMNVVELAAFSAQLIKLAKDQLAEIDRLKSKTKSRF